MGDGELLINQFGIFLTKAKTQNTGFWCNISHRNRVHPSVLCYYAINKNQGIRLK